ncbi:hypothetical protein FA743_09715 [Paracoccus gahaiensis]|uniref:Uncharacterized protein n=1 Tax=Paracoccus gahaiensis TaxID=1706839 RepID=A0A4U0R9R8_9RHOB|nr:hypothetical protein [Paracoccus gahaiensis]TJZ91747.1 hypothetical protein FA743_09715 [Paracoccus gahaiensis]
MFDIHTEAYLRRTQAAAPQGRTAHIQTDRAQADEAQAERSDRTLPALIATGMALCLGVLLALH